MKGHILENGEKTQIIHTRYGNFETNRDSSDLIVHFLEHYGEWAFLEVEFLSAYLPKKARVLDVGAYLGTFSSGLAQVADLDFVALVEGNPAIAPILERNADACLRCNHKVVPALVVNPGDAPITEGWAIPGNAGSATFSSHPHGAEPIQPVDERIGLTALVKRFGPLHLVKMDVEGMERRLLESAPELLSNESVLLWLECNETEEALALGQLLVDTGRPVTYFAWPSHNPRNHRGATQKIFPFSHEAGLLLGASPRALTVDQRDAQCVVRPIFTKEDLREALWVTPRWAPPEWQDLNESQLAAIAGHLHIGKTRDHFLSANQSALDGPAASSDDQWRRDSAAKTAQISRLERILLERDRREREQLRRSQSAEHVAAELRVAVEAEAQRQVAHAVQDAAQARHQLAQAIQDLAETRHKLEQDADEVRELLLRAEQEKVELTHEYQSRWDLLQGSTTWRGALRLSRIAGHIPFLKRAVKYVLRKKRERI